MPDVLRITHVNRDFIAYRALPSATDLSMPFDYLFSITFCGPTTPSSLLWFGLFDFARHYSRNHCYSSPPGTKMFQFPGLPSLKLCIGLRMIKLFNFYRFHSISPGSCLCTTPLRRFRRYLRPSFCSICQDIHRTLH